MDVKDLCLGALSFGDATGYDIKKFFENTFSHFFLAGYGSIYPALASLTAAGLVSCRTLAQHGKPDRKLYRLTAAGRRAFLDTLRDTTPRHRLKSEFLVLLYFAHLLAPARLQAIVDQQLRNFDGNLKHIRQYEDCCAAAQPLSPGAHFVCGYGKAVMTAASEYIRAHRHSLLPPTGRGAAPRKLIQARRQPVHTASRN
ncbi:MAG: PadR family transcriptional regulator [Gammaproteobacteria bacterium]|nr:PadR family transcriptional regulator [Gammaproteobacteria bacterium]